MSRYATPAKGHMPFPGHRTCAEWDRPVNLNAKSEKLAKEKEADDDRSGTLI